MPSVTTDPRSAGSKTATDDVELMTISGAADHLKVSEKTIRRAVADGTIKAMRRGRIIRVEAASVHNYLSPVR